MNKLKVGLISLGCDKNRIDSEIILGKVNEKYEITNDPAKAHIIIINTCGFIESAKQESIDTIIEMGEYKKNNCKVIAATGCLTQRYGKELIELMPEIDILLGVNSYDKLLDSIESFIEYNEKIIDTKYSDDSINSGKRILTTGNSTAYVRIGEGCDNFCTYCIIPKIRGGYRSRSIEEIISEVEDLVNTGIKEIILVAQDTTRYGIDLYGEKKLPELLNKLSKIENIQWIRVLYTYVEEITDELIEEIKTNPKVCKYIDMPIQHISDNILKRMNRKGKKQEIIDKINYLRESIPDICLRTSLIVGFPGETEEEFNELKEFVLETKFDKLGVFKYSQEENTPAAKMQNQINDETKEKRKNEIMIIQKEISKNIMNNKIGKSYSLLVEGKNDSLYYGRNYEMSPEVDGTIYFKYDDIIKKGDIINIIISKTFEYDMLGVVENESCKQNNCN